MQDSILPGLVQNAILLVVIALVYDLTPLRWRARRDLLPQAAIGLILGAIGITLMLTPWVLVPGIIFDTRSILLAIAGLFLGGIPTVLAMLITAAFRIYLGGTAVEMGVGVILVTGSLGIAWRYLRRRPLLDISWPELYLFGLGIHVAMLACTFILPWEIARLVFAQITLPVLLIYPLATALLGGLMANRLRHERTADELRESEDKFRYIFDHSIVGNSLTLPSGGINVNQAFCEMVGYTREELQNKRWQDITHPDDIEPTQMITAEILSGARESRRFTKRFIHKNGSTVWVDLSSSLRRDPHGGPLYFMSTLLDITERKQIEETLLKSEENYRQLFEQAADGIFIADGQGNFIVVNSSGCALLGYDKEEILRLRMVDLVLTENQKTGPLGMKEAVAGQHVFSERQMRRKDGEVVDVEISGSMLADGRFLGVVRDISKRKQAEDQIRHLNAELEERVRERTQQLEFANKELEAFAYSVSHDLRAPLRAMDGFSAALLSDYAGQVDEKGRHYLERIQEAARRMGLLINDLLSLSQVTRFEFNAQQVDLSALSQEIATCLRAQDPGRKVEFDITPGLIAQGDPHLLQIALENLLNNAYKFTGRRDEALIQVGALDQGGERFYYVRDNGVGFSMEFAGKLFTPFQRLHGMQEFPGTGIGLVIVQRIIQRHAGRVWPEAALNLGATFYFTLGGA